MQSYDLTVGNSCKACPSGYSCQGGLYCPDKSTITITLNKNGGTGDIGTGTSMVGGTSSATITCTAGSSCALPEWSSNVSASAKNTNITNGTKIFAGWATTSTATDGSFSFTPTASRTMYAVWKTPTCSVAHGSCTITTASLNRPTAKITCSTGYSQSGGANTTTSFTAYGEAGRTSVAASCAAKCNKISFNSTQNGGSGGRTTALYKLTGSTAWYTNNTCTLRYAATFSPLPTKTNATFAGFYNTSAATGGTQFINSSGTLLTPTVTGPTTLYAQYTCNTGYMGSGTRISGECTPNAYTITLNKNGGSGSVSNGSTTYTGTTSGRITCYYNEPCELPKWAISVTTSSKTTNITNGQKVFTGWATEPDGREGRTGKYTMTFTASDTIYAVWNTPTCTVTGGHGTCEIMNANRNSPQAKFTCYSGYAQTATSDTTSWTNIGTAGTTVVVDECVARQYTCDAGEYLRGASCATCTGANYCTGGTFTYDGSTQGLSACPLTAIDQTGYPWSYSADSGATAVTNCYVYGNATEFSDYCTAGQWRLYYDNNARDYVNLSAYQTVTAAAGAYVDTSTYFAPTCTQCGVGEYSAGGDATSCTSCNSGYTISGTALTDHDSASDCKITCSGGEYVPTAGDGCVNVGAGYWGAGGTVSQTSTLGRNACASGLTTIGSGLGADEAGDCGRVLNVGDEKIYLRSTKKTTPSLNISINGDVFYGNMSTATKGSLRINSGGTTYSVYDDSM